MSCEVVCGVEDVVPSSSDMLNDVESSASTNALEVLASLVELICDVTSAPWSVVEDAEDAASSSVVDVVSTPAGLAEDDDVPADSRNVVDMTLVEIEVVDASAIVEPLANVVVESATNVEVRVLAPTLVSSVSVLVAYVEVTDNVVVGMSLSTACTSAVGVIGAKLGKSRAPVDTVVIAASTTAAAPV